MFGSFLHTEAAAAAAQILMLGGLVRLASRRRHSVVSPPAHAAFSGCDSAGSGCDCLLEFGALQLNNMGNAERSTAAVKRTLAMYDRLQLDP